MSGFVLRQARIVVVAGEDTLGTSIDFTRGLNILRAESTSGKSTTIQSIIYALGLEGMLSATRVIPLPHAMTERIDSGGGRETPVTQSDVYVEIENSRGEAITVHRNVLGRPNNKLITVWSGPALTQPGDYPESAYFVRDPGAATREAGFHTFLAQFMGWTLPQVESYEGEDRLLYLETIFPLVFIEQKMGWSSLQPRFPTHLRIREVGKRATEFVLGLDAYALARRRAEIQGEVARQKESWTKAINDLRREAGSIGAHVDSLVPEPTADWPGIARPRVMISHDKTETALADVIATTRTALAQLENRGLRPVGAIASSAERELMAAEAALDEYQDVLRLALSQVDNERAELRALNSRYEMLQEDLQRNRDTQKILGLQSAKDMSVPVGECPTCKQSVDDTLLPQVQHHLVMDVGQNLKYLEQQRDVVLVARSATQARVSELNSAVDRLRDEIESKRRTIRGLRSTLTSDERAPALSDVEARVALTSRIDQLQRVARSFEEGLNRLAGLSQEWRLLQSDLQALPADSLSAADNRKLKALTGLVREQLRAYGFKSVDPDEVYISPHTYRPSHDGFDLHFDLSASDNIRAIWAYFLGLLEVGRTETTNHPKLLILDEPRQQSTAERGLAAFITRTMTSRNHREQVIIATSEPEARMSAILEGIAGVNYVSWPGRILVPMAS